MKTEDLRKFEGRKLKVKVSSGFVYSAKNFEVVDADTVSFIDKFGNELFVSKNEIVSILAEGGENGKE